MCAAALKEHQHGKSRVRLGRTWREGDVHHFVEWTVHTMLESDMARAFTEGSNIDMTATDTQKNTVRPEALEGSSSASSDATDMLRSQESMRSRIDLQCNGSSALRCFSQVYYIAKQCSQRCPAEDYAIALARHFVGTYPKVQNSNKN